MTTVYGVTFIGAKDQIGARLQYSMPHPLVLKESLFTGGETDGHDDRLRRHIHRGQGPDRGEIAI